MSATSTVQSFGSPETLSNGLLTPVLLDFSKDLNIILSCRIDELSAFFESVNTGFLTMCQRRVLDLSPLDDPDLDPEMRATIQDIYNTILTDLDFSLQYAVDHKLLPVLERLIKSDPCISSTFNYSTNYYLETALLEPNILDDLDMLFHLLDTFKDMLLDGATAQILGYALLNAVTNNNLPNIERLLSTKKDEIDRKMLEKAIALTKPTLQNVCLAKSGETLYTKGRPEALEIFRANCPEIFMDMVD